MTFTAVGRPPPGNHIGLPLQSPPRKCANLLFALVPGLCLGMSCVAGSVCLRLPLQRQSCTTLAVPGRAWDREGPRNKSGESRHKKNSFPIAYFHQPSLRLCAIGLIFLLVQRSFPCISRSTMALYWATAGE
jgi:hypothetical protein